MLNYELYVADPRQTKLLNNGVAELAEDHSAAGLQVLRHELETFVCDGQYATGLASILDTYLRNLDTRTEQPGVWISGFYGSGKSHLAKMLRALWTDVEFSDGARARGLAHLIDSVRDPLIELSKRSAQHGGLHAAAGKLGSGAKDYVRVALLEIIFKSAGLPGSVHQARFVLWLRREGLEAAVRSHLQAAGKTLENELSDMYVSHALAEAVLRERPDLAPSPGSVRLLFKEQFPQVTDISNDALVKDVHAALARGGKFPLTLVVLDEVQQYIGTDKNRVYQVQEMTETLSKHFTGQMLFVATGQSALSDTSDLQKLLGRFPNKVMLGDWDVENVTRKIILAKKPSAEAALKQTLNSHLGEITRHLRGTKVEHNTNDEPLLPADYPILPVRRRLWERLLRAVDATGTTAQLRNQLHVVHEAVLDTAEQPVGNVVAADFLYDQNAPSLASTGQLPREVYENVQRLEKEPAPGPLKARVLKLVYLLGKLPTEASLELGLRVTQDVLADLLITDLAAGSSGLRADLPEVLRSLQDDERLVMALPGEKGAEYRLQTRESSSWLEEFRGQEALLRTTLQTVDQRRSEALRAKLEQALNKVTIKQGKANEVRPLRLCWEEALPKDHHKALTVWLQDGWQSEERAVLAEARKANPEWATLFVFVPAEHRTELSAALIAREAAMATLNKKGQPHSPDGADARRNMEKRRIDAEDTIQRLLGEIVKGTRVFQAGGQEVTEGDDLTARVAAAAQASVVRLYPQFAPADHEGWARVVQDAQKGNVEALKAIAHTSEPEKHPVCQKILATVGGAMRGQEVRETFLAPPYGWPRDVVDGALLALLATGHLRATDAGGHALAATGFDRGKLSQVTFKVEAITLTSVQKIKIRGVFGALNLPNQPDQEQQSAPQVLPSLKALAQGAGGEAPAPAVPTDPLLDTLAAASGNALLLAIHDHAEGIKARATEWEATGKAVAARRPTWEALLRLLKQGQGLAAIQALQQEAEAIQAERRLLAEPDPVAPLREQAAQVLRAALNERLQEVAAAFETSRAALEADEAWQQISEAEREQLRQQHDLAAPAVPNLASAEAVAAALETRNLEAWQTLAQAVAGRFNAARLAAVKQLVPDVRHVKLPPRTLQQPGDLEGWLQDVRQMLEAELAKGPVSV